MKKPKANLTKNLPAKTSSKALSVVEEFDSGGNIPAGLENVTASDLIIPRLTILQDLSPQTKAKKAEYIKGAAPGMFCDVGAQQIFKDKLELLFVFYAKLYLEWAPRGTGNKGPVFNHGTDNSILQKCKMVEDDKGSKRPMINGNYIAETATYYLLNLSAHGRKSFLPMTSTQLSNSKRLMMQITNERVPRGDGTDFQPPIYYRSWIASVAEESNAKGDYFGWSFEPGRTILEIDPKRHLLEEAKDFWAQARMGLVRGDLTIEEDDTTGRGEGARM